jgi:hypothetical protein
MTQLAASGAAFVSPAVLRQLLSEVALTIIGGPNLAQIFQVVDRNLAPIFTIPTDGGPAVLGDRFRVFRPGSVINDDFETMTKSTDAVSADGAGFRLGHGLTQGNAILMCHGLPTATNPVNPMPPNGSWALRDDGAVGACLYQARGGVWVATAA